MAAVNAEGKLYLSGELMFAIVKPNAVFIVGYLGPSEFAGIFVAYGEFWVVFLKGYFP